MTDWNLDVTRLDAVVPPEGLQAEPGYEDQDPVTSHGFPPSTEPSTKAGRGLLRAIEDDWDPGTAALDIRAIEQEAADRAVAALTPLVEAALEWLAATEAVNVIYDAPEGSPEAGRPDDLDAAEYLVSDTRGILLELTEAFRGGFQHLNPGRAQAPEPRVEEPR